jgi:hypothetical protein
MQKSEAKEKEKEKEAELQRLHPDTSIASYLRYQCHYCNNPFYLVEPIRDRGLNRLHGGFILVFTKRLIPTCRNCILEMSRRNESISIKQWSGYVS